MARAYESLIHDTGWTHDYIEEVLTTGQIVMYLDAAQDRIDTTSRIEFEDAVFAHRIARAPQRAFQRWLSRRQTGTATRGRSLSGDALEAAVSRVASLFPGHVQRVTV